MSKDLHNNVCDKKIFARVYEKYAKDVHDFLYYKFGEQFNPSDKAQEAFIKLWENCKKVPFGSARSYLFTVANNLTLNDIKHQKVVLRYQKEKPVKEHTNESPEFLMEESEFLQRYQDALGRLSEEQRVAFTLSKIEGKKQQEIADMLGVSKKVVEYRIYSAFAKLKEELEGFKLK